MRHLVMFSGGIGSWAAAKRVVQQHGTRDLTLLFTDTLMEDEDTYRFLLDAAANVLRTTHTISVKMPPLHEDNEARRRQILRQTAQEAQRQIPGLIWLIDGRTPWDVCKDKRFLANTRVAHCSLELKQKPAQQYRDANFDPNNTVCYLGIDWSEEHRLLRTRKLAAPWRYEAPLCDPPYLKKNTMLCWARDEGVKPPRLYEQGFPHGNCSGLCFKAGQAQFALLHRERKSDFDYANRKEQHLREYLDKDIAILRDRRGGTLTPLTLGDFRARLEDTPQQCDLFEWGGCGCFTQETELKSTVSEEVI